MKRILSVLLILLITSLTLASCNPNKDSCQDGFTDLTLYAAEGGQTKLSTIFEGKGKGMVINFFASWCPPCKAEMPYFQEAYEEYGDDIIFVMVNVTGWEESFSDGRLYIESQGYTFPVYYDLDNEAPRFYEFDSVPRTVFVDKGATVKYTHAGMITYEQLCAELDKIK